MARRSLPLASLIAPPLAASAAVAHTQATAPGSNGLALRAGWRHQR